MPIRLRRALDRPSALRQRDALIGRIRIAAKEQCRVPNRADARAMGLGRNAITENDALVPIRIDEADLDQLVRPQELLEFPGYGGSDALATEFQGRIKPLAKAAKIGALRTGKWEDVHAVRSSEQGPGRITNPKGRPKTSNSTQPVIVGDGEFHVSSWSGGIRALARGESDARALRAGR